MAAWPPSTAGIVVGMNLVVIAVNRWGWGWMRVVTVDVEDEVAATVSLTAGGWWCGRGRARLL